MSEFVTMETLVRKAVLAEQGKKRPAEGDLRPTIDTKRSFQSIKTVDCERTQNKSSPSKRGGKRPKKEEFSYPIEPRIISVIKKPRTIVNHSYRDFSQLKEELSYEKPTNIEEMSFSEKLHDILSIEEYQPYIGWMVHGRSFRVHIPKVFEEQICSKYFGHSRYSSFLRLLNNYGFKHITKGADRNCYYHECFLRGMPHLCKYMPKPKNARHLVPDPENEPDFYRLSKLSPLADQKEEIKIPQLSGRKPTTVSASDLNSGPMNSEALGAGDADVQTTQVKVNRNASIPHVSSELLPVHSLGTTSLLAGGQSTPASVLTRSSLLRRQQIINCAAADQAALNNEVLQALRESLRKWTGGFRF
mmetsp:Transcript_1053/g.1327  ORF Transcript_1053/g.1327 Transcript_1053/m.1327 type:complete len:360 (+) Transcript_1053:66-1145(+)